MYVSKHLLSLAVYFTRTDTQYKKEKNFLLLYCITWLQRSSEKFWPHDKHHHTHLIHCLRLPLGYNPLATRTSECACTETEPKTFLRLISHGGLTEIYPLFVINNSQRVCDTVVGNLFCCFWNPDPEEDRGEERSVGLPQERSNHAASRPEHRCKRWLLFTYELGSLTSEWCWFQPPCIWGTK